MQQFRPLPRFDEMEVAESAEAQPTTTGTFPRAAQPARPMQPAIIGGFPRLKLPATPVEELSRPRLPATKADAFTNMAQPATTDTSTRIAQPKTTANAFTNRTEPTITTDALARIAQLPMTPGTLPTSNQSATGRVPVLLLSGPQRTPATDQLASVAKRTPGTGEHLSLAGMLQTALGTNRTKRLVIHADPKRRRARSRPARHMSLRLRHAIVLFTTLVVIVGFMLTLAPLSDGGNGLPIFQGFGSWIHSVQQAWGLQPQGVTITRADLNANLPYMSIPNSPYIDLAEQDAVDAGISPIYFVRQITQESGFNPRAVSVTNAQGIAQFEPATAAGLGIDPWDPVQALRGAAYLMANYAHNYGGNYAKALAAYNAGTGSLQAAERACGTNWLSCTPPQTRNYVYRIMGI